MTVTAPDYERVLDFWLGELDAIGRASAETRKRWWKKDEAFDQEIRERFAADHAAIEAGEREAWLASPRGRLAYVIVLDQFSRNMFRETPRMFASDPRAERVALEGVERGDDRVLALDARVFLYMPLMHSERLVMQERSVALFAALRDGLEGEAREHVAGNVDYAVRHRDIVARFGRFPHRNRLLGRESTEVEKAFLKEPGSSF